MPYIWDVTVRPIFRLTPARIPKLLYKIQVQACQYCIFIVREVSVVTHPVFAQNFTDRLLFKTRKLGRLQQSLKTRNPKEREI